MVQEKTVQKMVGSGPVRFKVQEKQQKWSDPDPLGSWFRKKAVKMVNQGTAKKMPAIGSVLDPDPNVFGPPGSGSVIICTIWIRISIIKQK
jgi:hypothetical protein